MPLSIVVVGRMVRDSTGTAWLRVVLREGEYPAEQLKKAGDPFRTI